MRFLAIIGISILAAILYGIVHDQITARVCIEYFTVGHAKVIDSDDPTLIALNWGVRATWWAGLFLGLGLATAARLGSRPKREIKTLLKPIAGLLIVMALFASIAGGAVGVSAVEEVVQVLLLPQDEAQAWRIDVAAEAEELGTGQVAG